MTVQTDIATVSGEVTEVSTSPIGALLIFLVEEATGPESFQLARVACGEHDVNADMLESDVSYWRQEDKSGTPYSAECAAWTVEQTLRGV